jgi:hypothetical protein
MIYIVIVTNISLLLLGPIGTCSKCSYLLSTTDNLETLGIVVL